MPEKLIRDGIAARIASSADAHLLRESRLPERHDLLCRKLAEEVGEYLESRNPDELTDILAVVYKLAPWHDMTEAMLEDRRHQRAAVDGEFEDYMVLAVANYSDGERAFCRQLVDREER